MSLTVANALNQYVFRRNYSTRKWENYAGDGRTCRVQVLKKLSGGDYVLRITPELGETREHRLSSENRVHFADGFIQVPVADSKELYGIKFKDVVQGEEFYMRMVQALGLPRSYPKTTIGDDGNPNPVGSGGPPQAPMTIAGGHLPHGQVLRASEPRPLQVQVLPTNQSVKLPPSMQRPMEPGPYEQPLAQPRQRVATYGGKPGTLRQHPHQQQQQQQLQQQLPNHFNHVSPSEQGSFNPGGPAQHRQQQMPAQHQTMSLQPGLPGQREGGGGSFAEQPSAGLGSRLIGEPNLNLAGKAVSRDVFDEPSQTVGGAPQYGMGMRPNGSGGIGMGSSPSASVGSGGSELGLSQQPGRLQPPTSRRRQPMSLAASDIQSVAESMVDAMNQGDEERTKHMFDILMKCVKEPDSRGKFALNFDNPKKTPPKSPSFMLNIQVEFQKPKENPLSIFLYDVTADDSITVLSARVEQEFYIPKLSQNWIIGNRLVKGNDANKSLNELGVKGGGVSEVNVFMYVMHTRKAQVPSETTRMRQQAHRQQQQQDLQNIQRQAQRGMMDQGQVGNHTDGGFQQLSQLPHLQQAGPYQGQPHNIPVVDEQATYSRLGNRGYDPQPATQGRRYFEGANDPTYSRLEDFQRPDPHLINGGALPHQQGGGMGMEMGRQGIGMEPRTAGNIPQQYNPLPSAHVAQMQYQQRQRSMNAQSHFGLPQQLMLAPQQQQPSLRQQAPPPAAPAKPKEPQGWVCPQCTLVNNPRRPGCELCSCARPENYVVPEEAPLADFERRAKENEALFEQTWKEKAEEHYREMVNADNAELVTNPEPFECQICYLEVEAGDGIVLRDCLHQFCRECIKQSVMQSNEAEVKCPFNDKYECNAVISEREIKACVTEQELQAYHKRVVSQAENALPNSFHCKTPDCRGWCINEDEVNEFRCPVCGKTNCILCNAIHEGMNCKEYQDDLKRLAENDLAAKATQDMLEKLVQNGEAMHCPQCKVIVQKKEGCDWIRCSMCKTEICWATKGPRWGPNGRGDISGGCRCRVNGKKCHPLCRNCH